MSNAQDLNSGTTEVRSEHRFDEDALAGWMAETIPDHTGPLYVGQFKGGQSNPTYQLITPVRRYVLRRKPPGALLKGAHAVEREAEILSKLNAVGFPVARVYGLCTDDAVIGTWFYVMEMIEGRIFWDATLAELPPAERHACYDAMNATIARLHRLDPVAIGLGNYGRPGNYFSRQIARWSRQYLEDKAAGLDPNMDRLAAWLPDNIPESDETRIVHGDFRIDNMIFDPVEPRVLAVLDWELSTLGHPLADFAYNAMSYHMPAEIVAGLDGVDPATLGLPTEAEYVAMYCQRTARESIPDYDFYLAFNFFRLAAIFHGIAGRVVRGTAASSHARERAAYFPRLAEIGWQRAQISARQ